MMSYFDGDAAFVTTGEARMMPQLVAWLRSARWLRDDSVLLRELPVHGRRVDLVSLTRSGVLSSFELKLGGFGRVLEQASYNRHTFDKSWIVTGGTPLPQNLSDAAAFGVGVIVIAGGAPKVLRRPGSRNNDAASRKRVVERIKEMRLANV